MRRTRWGTKYGRRQQDHPDDAYTDEFQHILDPPRFARFILSRMRTYDESHLSFGDLGEEYRKIAKDLGRNRAGKWYAMQVFRSILPYFHSRCIGRTSMLKNYLKIAFRYIRKHKVYSCINILGLTMGLSCCLMIYLWIQDELRYDRFEANSERIAQVYVNTRYSDGRKSVFMGSFYPLARLIREEVPGIAAASRYDRAEQLFVRRGDTKFVDNAVALADREFFDLFTFRWVYGDPRNAFADPASVVLTQSMARRYFGDENPMGQTLSFLNQFDLIVTGLIEDLPGQSSLQFDCVIPFAWMFGGSGDEPLHWGGNPLSTFILLDSGVPMEGMEERITRAVDAQKQWPEGMTRTFHLHPMKKWHLFNPEGGGSILLIVLFSAIALAVLIIACINFMNLSTARSMVRAGEIGLRKVVGAQRSDLIRQFFGESIILAFIALFLSLGFLSLFLPALNSLLNKQFTLGTMIDPSVIAGVLVITILTGVVSGSYPAFFLSALRPASVIQGSISRGRRGATLRRILVVLQFSLSIFLVIGMLAITRQMKYMMTEDLGLDREHIVSVLMTNNLKSRYEALRTELLRDANIISVSKSLQHPSNISSTVSALDWKGKDPQETITFHWDYIGYEYFETMGIEVLAGRVFSRQFPSDEGGGYIVNETAARMMGLESPLGEHLSVFRREGRIVGVVKDFHFRPFYHAIRPFVFILNPESPDLLLVRMRPGGISAGIQHIERIYKQFESDYPFRYRFFDDFLRQSIYVSEYRIGRIAGWFTLLAIMVSALGLYGLSAFVTERRTKEIGIRKVLGASIPSMIVMLCKDFIKWVLIANLLAWPAAYFALRLHLQRYAYRIDISLEIFLIAGLSTLGIAVLTVWWQTFRTASINPVDTLHFE